ncbi:hypothetical protein Tco_0159272, partial [Tanacetum coccineum]
MPLMGTMLPPAQAAIAGESSGEDAPSNPQSVHATITEPDHFHDHESTPPRLTTTTFGAPVIESTQAPSEGTTSGGAEDLDKLTTLSSLEVVGKLIKKVKLLEDKLKGRKRKFVMTNSDKEEDAEQDVDPLIKLAKAAAIAAAASAVPTGGSHEAEIPSSPSVPTGGSHEAEIPSSPSVPTDEFAGSFAVPAGATTGPSTDPANKGKSPLMEEDP